MSDTRNSLRLSDAISNGRKPYVLLRKPPTSNFCPQVRDQIVYLFKHRKQDPRMIAGELTRRSGVRVRVVHINQVLRSAIPDGPRPSGPASVVPITKKAA